VKNLRSFYRLSEWREMDLNNGLIHIIKICHGRKTRICVVFFIGSYYECENLPVRRGCSDPAARTG